MKKPLPLILARLRPGTEEGVALARGAGIAFFLQVAGAGLAYIMQIAFARWMGATSFGAFTFTFGWSSLLAVLTGLGLSTAVLRFLPAYTSHSDWARLKGLLRVSLIGTLLASVIVAVLGTGLVLGFGTYGQMAQRDALLGVWLVPAIAVMTLQQETARAFRRIGLAYTPSLLIRPTLAIVAALLYVTLGNGLGSAAGLSITLISIVLAITVQAVGFYRGLDRKVKRSTPIYDTRAWLSAALPLLFIASFIVVLMQTDVVMVGALLGSRAAGIYGAAAKTASLVGLVLIAVNAIAAPVFSSLFAEHRHKEIQSFASNIAHWIFWPSLLISSLLALFATPVLNLFGTGFSSASNELTILLVGQVVSAGAGSVGWLMLLTGHQNKAAWVYGWIAIIHVALLAISIPLFGLIGAALATTLSFSLWNVWLHRLVVRNIQLHPSIIFALRRHRGWHRLRVHDK